MDTSVAVTTVIGIRIRWRGGDTVLFLNSFNTSFGFNHDVVKLINVIQINGLVCLDSSQHFQEVCLDVAFMLKISLVLGFRCLLYTSDAADE